MSLTGSPRYHNTRPKTVTAHGGLGDPNADAVTEALEIQVRWHGQRCCVITLAGELDVATAPDLMDRLREVLEEDAQSPARWPKPARGPPIAEHTPRGLGSGPRLSPADGASTTLRVRLMSLRADLATELAAGLGFAGRLSVRAESTDLPSSSSAFARVATGHLSAHAGRQAAVRSANGARCRGAGVLAVRTASR